MHLTTGRDPFRLGDGGPRTQPGSAANVEGIDKERHRAAAAVDQRLTDLERDLAIGRRERVRRELSRVIALIEQAHKLPGHRRRQKRLDALIRQSMYAARPTSATSASRLGFTKRLRPRA